MPKPSKRATDSFTAAAINSGGQMMLMISSMGQAIELASDPADRSADIGTELRSILGQRLRDRHDAPPSAALESAAAVLAWATAAIGEEVFDSDAADDPSRWVPEVRARVRHLDDGDIPFADEERFREAG